MRAAELRATDGIRRGLIRALSLFSESVLDSYWVVCQSTFAGDLIMELSRTFPVNCLVSLILNTINYSEEFFKFL